MAKDFHDQEFDSGTRVKLDIYQRYLQEWLPVFIHRKDQGRAINVFDFFSGPGADQSGTAGSPILAVRKALEYSKLLEDHHKIVSFYFFDADKNKISALREKLAGMVGQGSSAIRVTIECKPFSEALSEYLPVIQSGNNFIFIDQCGIKQVNPDVFRRLASLSRTDLLFFSASSYLKRFASTDEFSEHIKLDINQVRSARYSDIHRLLASYYRGIARESENDYFIAPFSIKKDSNIYGLIFGSGHLLGLDKFLRICWKIDPERGEANYDIDDDGLGPTPFLVPEWNVPKKLEVFKRELREEILSGRLPTDADVFRYALENGCLGSHAKPVVMELLKEKVILMRDKKDRPRISAEALSGPREFFRP